MLPKRLSLGFSLVEVLCALVVFSVAMLSLAQLQAQVVLAGLRVTQSEGMFHNLIHMHHQVLLHQRYLKASGGDLTVADFDLWEANLIASLGSASKNIKVRVCQDDRDDPIDGTAFDHVVCQERGMVYIKLRWKMPASSQAWTYVIPI